jgi:hypothetical protein
MVVYRLRRAIEELVSVGKRVLQSLYFALYQESNQRSVSICTFVRVKQAKQLVSVRKRGLV